jgi:hypothetical protein
MNNLSIETQVISREHNSNSASQMNDRSSMTNDHDIREIAVGFGRQFGNRTAKPDFSTTTLGEVTFRRVDPLRDPFQVADARLQTRLESLCETLRAKY